MLRLSSLLSLVILVKTALAYGTFSPNCNIPSVSTSDPIFVSGPETRGTLNILWSCLATIFLCTWTIQHPNVPEQRLGQGWWRWKLKTVSRDVRWFLVTVLAPEWYLYVQLNLYQEAHELRERCRELNDSNSAGRTRSSFYRRYFRSLYQKEVNLLNRRTSNTPATVGFEISDTYSRFVCMGGFAIEVPPATSQPPNGGTILEMGPTSTFAANTAGRSDEEQASHSFLTSSSTGSIHVLDSAEFYHLCKTGFFSRAPPLSDEQIEDKGKSDLLSKVITVGQTAQFVVQLFIRWGRHRSISQLEIGTAAFAFCALITSCVCWNKPHKVNVPLIVTGDISKASSEEEEKKYDVFSIRPYGPSQSAYTYGNPDVTNMSDAILVVTGSLFGAVHLIAWSFQGFGTKGEQLGWQIAAILVTVLPVVACYLLIQFTRSMDHERDIRAVLYGFFYSVCFPLYIAARVFLIVEMFRTLAFLPPKAFVATLASSIPGIS